eukprot:918513-Prorocentrum_minimum.AAC.1
MPGMHVSQIGDLAEVSGVGGDVEVGNSGAISRVVRGVMGPQGTAYSPPRLAVLTFPRVGVLTTGGGKDR